jgi:hypothetical protein
MNRDTGLSLLTLLAAAVGIVVLLWVIPAPASTICVSKQEARHLWPRIHIFWFRDRETGDKCWSNRRGPPRGLKLEPMSRKEKKIHTDPVFPPKAQIKTVEPTEVNELDAMAREEPMPFVMLSDKLQGWAIWWASRVGEVFK